MILYSLQGCVILLYLLDSIDKMGLLFQNFYKNICPPPPPPMKLKKMSVFTPIISDWFISLLLI